jgi:xanthine dehydrogenase accessory factor
MQDALRRWHGGDDLARARAIAAQLRGGRELVLCGSDLGSERESQLARPDARLLIVGAGHCGLALYQLAQFLDFDLWVFDPRPDCFGAGQFARAECLNGGFELLARANATTRSVFAVLLNRDFHTDVAALEVLCRKPPAFMAMMGSGKRIAQVRAALPQHAVALHALEAPVGIEIAAQSPHEIAVSILAQLILRRRQLAAGVPAAMGTAQIG